MTISICYSKDENHFKIGLKTIFFFSGSQLSDRSDHHHTAPPRKRSILVNGGQGNNHGDGESIYSHHSHGMCVCVCLTHLFKKVFFGRIEFN